MLLGIFFAFELTDTKGRATFAATGRPEQIAWWLKRARKVDPPIEEDEIEDFGEQWWVWWKALQPKWRETDSVAGPLTPKHQRGHGDWGTLDATGVNGFLSVIAALGWWGEMEKGVIWLAAVEDVCWALKSIAKGSKRDLDFDVEIIKVALPASSKRQRTA